MTNASRDENHVTTLLAVSSVDGVTPVTLYADPVTHRLLVNGGSGGGVSIGGMVTGGTNGSVLFINPAGILAQNNNNFYIQNSSTTPQQLATNTNVALSVNTGGDFTGTDAINAYGVYDAYLPFSAIINSLTGLNTDGAVPIYGVSSSAGTGASPVQLTTGSLVGGFFGFGAQGASSPTYQNLGGMGIFTTGSSTNNLGGELRWYTKADGGSLTQRMAIDNAGQLIFSGNGVITSSGTNSNLTFTPSGTGTNTFNSNVAPFASGNIFNNNVANVNAITAGFFAPNLIQGTITQGSDMLFGVAASNGNSGLITFNYSGGGGSVANTIGFGIFGSSNTMYISNSKVSIGTPTASALLHILGTTEQLRLAYDASNYMSTTIASTGAVTIGLTGTNSGYTFNTIGTGAFNFNAVNSSVSPNVLNLFAPNATAGAGSGPYANFGVANSAGNTAILQFVYVAAASNSNSLAIGIAGTAAPLNIFKGSVGIGTAGGIPFDLLANTISNITDSNNVGVTGTGSTVWAVNGAGYAHAMYNASTNASANGLLVKIAGTASTNKAFSIDRNASQATAGTNLLTVTGSGNVGIGIASPSARLHLSAGTATANTAPLQFNAGVSETAARAGVTEYDGTNLFFTPSGTTRKVVSLYQDARSTAQTAAVVSVVAWTVGAADGSFLISSNVNVTAFSVGTFNVTVAYTDETNTARTLTLNFSSVTGTLGIAIAAAGAFEGIPVHIRAKAATTITIATSGTFTSLTYNVEGAIAQIA